jgi:hypothetical protein
MITKAARLSLIAAACVKLGTAQRVNAVLYPSRHDVREETTLARERDRGELPVDDDLPTLASSLSFDNADAREDDAILSAKERKALAREVSAYRIRQDLSRPVSPYALALV